MGIEPTIRVLQSALKGPSPSSSVHFIFERATVQPSSSANVCSQPSVLLSVLLSKKPRLGGAVLRRDSDMLVAQDGDKSRRTTTVLKQAARCRGPVSPSCCVMLGRGGERQQLRTEQRSTAVPHGASGYQLCCVGFQVNDQGVLIRFGDECWPGERIAACSRLGLTPAEIHVNPDCWLTTGDLASRPCSRAWPHPGVL